ncbi:hypothetical protein BDA96_02G247000 [Sorghum bicolor]|uniref:Uncharacterized protein n=2 Tax=Sorghum bicolor TaxID=4558 RepID=A0A921RR30_SORBI|nr:hypothetical protein BDA96_02G247000 [Sorghum bicolor]KXG35836.1 hypothetical protein SORBI_3002G236000 [Sorghum bicolor]
MTMCKWQIFLVVTPGDKSTTPGNITTHRGNKRHRNRVEPPWDAYGAPPGRRICAGDATGRRIYAAAGGGRRRCGRSLPASAQIRPAACS